MYLVLILLGITANVSAQASSNIEFSGIEPESVNVQNGALWWWIGGDGSSPVILYLMQGCDPLDATTVEPMASVCPPSNKLSVPPNNKLAGDGSDQFEYQRSLQWNPSQYFPESSVLLF